MKSMQSSAFGLLLTYNRVSVLTKMQKLASLYVPSNYKLSHCKVYTTAAIKHSTPASQKKEPKKKLLEEKLSKVSHNDKNKASIDNIALCVKL